MLPNVLMIGTAKSATGMICQNLARHPEVSLSRAWEPNFFSIDSIYERGLPYYEGLFNSPEGKVVVAEKSWTYTVKELYPNALGRIVKHCPGAKLIYVARHPFRRIESLYVQLRKAGQAEGAHATLAEAIRKQPLYIKSSLFWSQLNAFRSHYPDDRIKVMFYEDLSQGEQPFLNEITSFLGLTPFTACTSETEDGQRRNQTTNVLVDSSAVMAARRIPLFKSVRDAMPARIRERLSEILKTRMEDRPAWDADSYQLVWDAIGPDVTEFLKRFSKAPDYWDTSRESVLASNGAGNTAR